MAVIHLPDEEAAALTAKAAQEGLTLEAWLTKLAAGNATSTNTRAPAGPRRHIAEIIRDNMQDVAPEAMANMPADGASEHDHYIYGWPKREP